MPQMTCLFKLKHDIRVESKIDVARKEIEVLIGKPVEDVVDISILTRKKPFIGLDDEVLHIINRIPYLGKLQGFLCKTELKNVMLLIKRVTFCKELFFIFETDDYDESLRCLGLPIYDQGKYSENNINLYTQAFLGKSSEGRVTVTLRVIPFHAIFEYGLDIAKLPLVTFTKSSDIEETIRLKEKGVEKGIQMLFNHLNNNFYRPPNIGLRKEHVGDYIDWAYKDFKRSFLHKIHKFKGKVDERLARSLVNTLDVRDNAIILDPFCGSGTFIADCSAMDLRCIGFDIIPLAVLISNVKCNLSLDLKKLRKEIILIFKDLRPKELRIDHSSYVNTLIKIPKKFRKRVIEKERKVKAVLAILKLINGIDQDDIRDYFLVNLSNALTLTLDYKQLNPISKFKTLIVNNYINLLITQQLASILELNLEKERRINCCNVYDSDDFREKLLSTSLVDRYEDSIDGIVTSPPYFDALPYLAFTVHPLVLLGLVDDPEKEVGSKLIGFRSTPEIYDLDKLSQLPFSSRDLLDKLLRYGRSKKKSIVAQYLIDMSKAFSNFHKVLKPNGRMIMVVGRIHKWKFGEKRLEIDGASILIDLAEAHGFFLEEDVSHNISKIDRRRPWLQVQEEAILLFRKKNKSGLGPPSNASEVKIIGNKMKSSEKTLDKFLNPTRAR